MRKNDHKTVHKTYPVTDTSTNTPCLVTCTTASVTPKTTNSNSLLPNTASNDIQQHVNSANSGDVDIRNLTVTTYTLSTRIVARLVISYSKYNSPKVFLMYQKMSLDAYRNYK
jgi:hypothetical protein